jgi:magnesium chelatase family protein
MALARVRSIALVGITGHVIDVEVDISDGLPGYTLLGLPDAALSESKERVRSALINSGAPWPNKRVTVSLSPAWLPKSGSGFDLPIAIALLVAQGLLPHFDINEHVFLGELALTGAIKSIRGVLPALLAAARNGMYRAILPMENLSEGSVVTSIESVGMRTLLDVISYLESGVTPEQQLLRTTELRLDSVDLSDVAGQSRARFALEISAIGAHHLLFIASRSVLAGSECP